MKPRQKKHRNTMHFLVFNNDGLNTSGRISCKEISHGLREVCKKPKFFALTPSIKCPKIMLPSKLKKVL